METLNMRDVQVKVEIIDETEDNITNQHLSIQCIDKVKTEQFDPESYHGSVNSIKTDDQHSEPSGVSFVNVKEEYGFQDAEQKAVEINIKDQHLSSQRAEKFKTEEFVTETNDGSKNNIKTQDFHLEPHRINFVNVKQEYGFEDAEQKDHGSKVTEATTVRKSEDPVAPKKGKSRVKARGLPATVKKTRADKKSTNIINIADNADKTCSKEKLYKCDICKQCFSDEVNLKDHVRVHTGETPYKCDICNKFFKSENNLKGHGKVHTGEQQHKCGICGRCFTRKCSLEIHVHVHKVEKPHKCKLCGNSFSCKLSLNNHVRHIHFGGKPYKCDMCEKSFNAKCNLKDHIRVHTGEKPFKCDICQVSLKNKNYLKNHMLLHSTEKPYKCEVCGVGFKLHNYLKNHMTVHAEDNPNKCTICDKNFLYKCNLYKHIRNCHLAKPYKCEACGTCFTRRSYFKKHICVLPSNDPLM